MVDKKLQPLAVEEPRLRVALQLRFLPLHHVRSIVQVFHKPNDCIDLSVLCRQAAIRRAPPKRTAVLRLDPIFDDIVANPLTGVRQACEHVLALVGVRENLMGKIVVEVLRAHFLHLFARSRLPKRRLIFRHLVAVRNHVRLFQEHAQYRLPAHLLPPPFIRPRSLRHRLRNIPAFHRKRPADLQRALPSHVGAFHR